MENKKRMPCGSTLKMELNKFGARTYILDTTDGESVEVWDTSKLHQCVLIEAIAADNKYRYEAKQQSRDNHERSSRPS